MKRIFLIAAMLALPSTVALAAIDTDGLISSYQAEGYTTIEVTRGLSETKVEAIREGAKIEVIYDNATGAVLKRESGSAEPGDDIRPGVTLRDRNRNFLNDDDGDDDGDDMNDDRNDDRDDDRDDDHDDDRGHDDRGGDDRGGDDRGGDDD